MECNIIILSEEQTVKQLNLSFDAISIKVNCHIATTFHDGIYQVLRYPYDLIILTVLQSIDFTYQAGVPYLMMGAALVEIFIFAVLTIIDWCRVRK